MDTARRRVEDASELLVLPGEPQAARLAREHVRREAQLLDPGATEAHLDDVALVASELVTNAIRYGTEPGDSFAVIVLTGETGTRVEVRDPVRRRPRRRPESEDRQRGRGLLLLDALCPGQWGCYDTPFGKAVWAEVVR
ncbi:ATP-binding protein [Streptomyces sp. NPDC088923]|uniref:ATP-binding protein n=1 Tax=Streptomyces sp. NPDC088923 TaxID=3365913 RepID=UPI003821523B